MSKFGALQIKFDKDYLNKLTADPNSGVFKQNCKYHIALHPAEFSDLGQSIRDALGRKIATYDQIFQGILLGYENVKLQSDLGVIGLENLYIHIDIQADFFVFRPEIDMILKGVVTKTTKDHVGCLVYSTFNISLPKPVDEDENWLGNEASIESDVVFKIIFVDLTSRLPFIKGKLISVSCPNESGLPVSPKKSKYLNKKIKFKENNEAPPKSKKKHKKKSTEAEENCNDDEILSNIYEEYNGMALNSKKKKHNKHDKALKNLEIKKKEEEIISNIRYEQNNKEHNSMTPNSEKKHKKKHDKHNETLENVEIKEEQNEIVTNIGYEDNNNSMKKHEKKHNKHKETLENLEIKEEYDEILSNIRREEDYSLTLNSKKHKKKNKKHSETVKNLEIKEVNNEEDEMLRNIKFEDSHEEDSRMTPNSKKKYKEKHKHGETLKNLDIKKEVIEEEETTEITKRHKKKHKPDYDEQDEEVLKKGEKRQEKKRKREQNESDISLESLNLKELFDGTVSVNTNKLSQSMADQEDRGKKRRKSNSISQEVYLERVKLEENSDLEKIVTVKKQKRSKSLTN